MTPRPGANAAPHDVTAMKLEQKLSYVREHYPLIFWGEIGVMLAIVAVLIVGGIFAYRLRSWYLKRLVAYVEQRYSEEWHTPANLRWVCGLGALLVVGTIVALTAWIHNTFTIFALPMMVVTLLFIVAADGAFAVQERLTGKTVHVFAPRYGMLYSFLSLIHDMPPSMRPAFLPRVPVVTSWACRLCGKPRSSPKHLSGP